MELWQQLSVDDDIFQRRMDGYDSLPQEECLEKYREEVSRIEAEILKITGDPIADPLWKTLTREDSMEIADHLLDNRRYVLSKMFALHCGDAEVKRIEALDARLLQLSRNLFERTAKMHHAVLDIPIDERDDDISVEGTLRYVGDTARDILQLEDDAFYGSDFKRMILILSYLETGYRGDLPILNCQPEWDPEKKRKSSLTDKYLGMEDQWMEDGTTWAEGWLRHPKLDHIVMCYATHALVTHSKYCIPDHMRLNSFEVKVEVVVRQDAEQDGSRMWWWTRCSLRQFKDKFLHADGGPLKVWGPDALRGRMFVQFVALCYYEYLSKKISDILPTLGKANGDEAHDSEMNLKAEKKLKSWMENTPLCLQLQWFDTVENVRVSTKLTSKRWSTEITMRDKMYLDRLGVRITE